MSNVVNLSDFRKPKFEIEEAKDLQQLCQECSDEIAEGWAKAAKINRLNEYFISSVPTWTEEHVDYLSDLNALSFIENKIKLPLILRSPQDDTIGWAAGFKFQNEIIESAPIYFTEHYARCFNILLFLKLRRATN